MKMEIIIAGLVTTLLTVSGCISSSNVLVNRPTGGEQQQAETGEYASFYLSTGGVTNVAAIETTLVINEVSYNSDSTVFGLDSNQVTVNKTGVYKITGECYFNTGGSSRSEFTIWLENNGVDVDGTRSGIYERGYDSGSTGVFTVITSLTDGDVLQIRIQRTDGGATTGYQDNYGTRLTIEELI